MNDNLPKTFWTATKEPPLPHRLFLRHTRLGDLYTCIEFRVAPHLVLDILLGTSLIDHFIRGILPSVRKTVTWHSQSEATMAHAKGRKISINSTTFHTILPKPVNKTWTTIPPTRCFSPDKLGWNPTPSAIYVFVMINSNDLLAAKPRALPLNRYRTLPTHGITDNPPGQPYYMLESSLSNLKVRWPKRMTSTNTATSLNVSHTIDSSNQNVLAIRITELVRNPSNDLHFIGLSNTEYVFVGHYKSTEDRKPQVSRYSMCCPKGLRMTNSGSGQALLCCLTIAKCTLLLGNDALGRACSHVVILAVSARALLVSTQDDSGLTQTLSPSSSFVQILRRNVLKHCISVSIAGKTSAISKLSRV